MPVRGPRVLVGLCALVAGLAPVAATAGPAMRVAVPDFRPAAGDPGCETLGRGLRAFVAADLSEVPAIGVVDRDHFRHAAEALGLGDDGGLDAAAAARVARSTAATHLVSGSFSATGTRLRLEARLVAVGTGEVVATATAEGERAVFHKLQKGLVADLLAGAGVRPSPDEGARLARVHSSDFDNFRSYCDGLAQLEEKRYAKAVDTLHQVGIRNFRFSLALIALARAEDLAASGAGPDPVASPGSIVQRLPERYVREEAAIVERLQQVARTGAPFDREVALFVLAEAYGTPAGVRRLGKPLPLQHLRDTQDVFALQRLADDLHRRYRDGVAAVFPAVPPFVVPDNSDLKVGVEFPDSMAGFRADFARAGSEVRDAVAKGLFGIDYARLLERLAERLHLDRRGEARLFEETFRLGLKRSPRPGWKRERLLELADMYLRVLDLDRSEAFLSQVDTRDAEAAAEVARYRALERDLAATLGTIELATPAREYLVLEDATSLEGAAGRLRELFAGATLSGPAASALLQRRHWPSGEGYLLVGDEPVWRLQGSATTGPRLDRDRADEIRYGERFFNRASQVGFLAAVGAAPRDRFSARFHVSFEPPADYRLGIGEGFLDALAALPSQGRRPLVGFLFGLKDVQCEVRRMSGYRLAIERDVVRLSRVVAAGDRRAQVLAEQVVKEWPVALGAVAEVDVAVDLDGDELRVAVGDTTLTAPRPDDAGGFLGLQLVRTGYAAVRGLAVSPRP